MRLVLDTNIVMDLLHFSNRHTLPLQALIAGGQLQCFSDSDCLSELERVTGYLRIGKEEGDQTKEKEQAKEPAPLQHAPVQSHKVDLGPSASE